MKLPTSSPPSLSWVWHFLGEGLQGQRTPGKMRPLVVHRSQFGSCHALFNHSMCKGGCPCCLLLSIFGVWGKQWESSLRNHQIQTRQIIGNISSPEHLKINTSLRVLPPPLFEQPACLFEIKTHISFLYAVLNPIMISCYKRQ